VTPSQIVFSGLFDDVSLLGGASASEALAAHRGARSGRQGWMMGVVVCPAGALEEYAALAVGEPPPRVCVIAGGRSELARAADHAGRPDGAVESVVLPAAGPAPDLDRAAAALPGEVLPRVPVEPGDVREMVAAVEGAASARERLGRALGVAVWLDGAAGAHRAAVVLDACRRLEVPARWLGCSGRLDPAALVAAAAIAVDRRASVAALERVLGDGAAVGFEAQALTWSGVAVAPAALRAARAGLVQGIASPRPPPTAAAVSGRPTAAPCTPSSPGHR
jgi:hypothetical protein